uniref:IRF tryptophan pentad repeat domain-containing protein n=1 Tax=Cairina moschata TaxID=8855 RepID=A0A8C3GNQ5_CAIMO
MGCCGAVPGPSGALWGAAGSPGVIALLCPQEAGVSYETEPPPGAQPPPGGKPRPPPCPAPLSHGHAPLPRGPAPVTCPRRRLLGAGAEGDPRGAAGRGLRPGGAPGAGRALPRALRRVPGVPHQRARAGPDPARRPRPRALKGQATPPPPRINKGHAPLGREPPESRGYSAREGGGSGHVVRPRREAVTWCQRGGAGGRSRGGGGLRRHVTAAARAVSGGGGGRGEGGGKRHPRDPQSPPTPPRTPKSPQNPSGARQQPPRRRFRVLMGRFRVAAALPAEMTSGRRRLLPWLLAQAQSGRFPGLEFDDAARSALRVPWERAGRGGAGGGAAAALCQAWAEYKGATPPPGPATCKTRLRCALHKSPELQELPERARLDGPRPYKVYRLLGPRPPRHGSTPRRSSKGRKEEAEPRGDDAVRGRGLGGEWAWPRGAWPGSNHAPSPSRPRPPARRRRRRRRSQAQVGVAYRTGRGLRKGAWPLADHAPFLQPSPLPLL